MLQFGTYDLSAQTPAGRLIADEYFLQAYTGTAADRTHPNLSPIYAALADLPPVLMVVGDTDSRPTPPLMARAALDDIEVSEATGLLGA